MYYLNLGIVVNFLETLVEEDCGENSVGEGNIVSLMEELGSLCNYFPSSHEMYYVTDDLDDAESVQAYAIELVSHYLADINVGCIEVDFPITTDSSL